MPVFWSKYIAFIGISLFCFINIIKAQESNFIFYNYTIEDGLQSNECHDLLQDKQGNIWISTDNGVSKFNGYEFINYGPLKGLMDPVIFEMKQDLDDRIWMAGLNSRFYIYEPAKDSFLYAKQNLILDSLTTVKKKYHEQFIIENNILTTGIFEFGFVTINSNNEFSKIEIDNSYYVGLVNEGHVLNSVSRLHKFENEFKVFNKNGIEVYSLKYDKDYVKNDPRLFKVGLLNLVSFKDSLFVLNEDFELINKKEFPRVLDIYQTEDLNIFIVLDKGNEVRRYSNLNFDNYERLISQIKPTSIIQDNEGGIWITTMDRGLFYIPNLNVKYLSDFYKNNTFSQLSCYSSKLFLGRFDGEISSYDLNTSQMTILKEGDGNELFMLINNKEELWYSSLGEFGVFKNNSSRIINNEFHTKAYNWAPKDLIFKKNKIVGISTYYISELSKNDYSLNNFSKDKVKNFDEIRKNCIHLAKDSSVYICSDSGVFKWELNKPHSLTNLNKELNRSFESISEDNEGNLFLGTKAEGVFKWDKNNNLVNLGDSHKLRPLNIEDIHFDEYGHLWIATLNGLHKMEFKQNSMKTFRSFGLGNGLPCNDIYQIKSRKDTLYLATGKGVISFIENPLDTISPPPIINSIFLNDQKLDLDNALNFSYDQNDINIHYLTNCFSLQSNVPYRYSLNNRPWIETKETVLNFIDLAPNKYKFEIQSQNADQIWSESSTINFKIARPWWESLWFYFLVFMTIIGVVGYIINNNIKKLKRENKIKDEIRELEKSALQAQMSPHFIFNCLNSIQNFIMDNDKEKAMSYLSKFSKLIRKSLEASTESKICLEDEISMLKNYLNLEKLRFRDRFEYQFYIDPTINQITTLIPPLLVQPFVENAILHGMKDINADGIIRISFVKNGEHLNIMIEDNGQYDQQKNHNPNHKSLGMSITRKRLKHINQSTQSNYDIIREISDEGTTIKIQINLVDF